MAPSLCDTCKEVLRPRELDLSPRKSFALLETSTHLPEHGIQEGCSFCIFLSSMLSEEDASVLRKHMAINNDPDLPTDMKYSTTYKVQMDSRKCLWVIFHHKGALDHNGEKILRHVALLPNGRIHDVNTSISTAPKESWDLARFWLRECNTHHSECKRSAASNVGLPSRLLHVGRAGSTSMRLCEQVPPASRYVTLSHCWEVKHKPPNLLESNLASFKKGLPIAELPKTFRHAVEVAHNLDIEYIWIDSFSIIQDSASDWAKESALMHQVYSNAVFNIAATAATNCQEGLFIDRELRSQQPYYVGIDWSSEHRGKHVCIDSKLWERAIETGPLEQRAWVFQERVLSTRNLHFGRTQLFWECKQHRACERFPLGLPPLLLRGGFNLKSLDLENGASRRESMWLDAEPKLNAHALWYCVVEAYTNGSLTYGTDKLIACSAIAKHCHDLIGKDAPYLAGLWRSYLAYQLLWRTTSTALGLAPTRGRHSRQKVYRAPSWSWASIDGNIESACLVYNADEKDILIRIHSAQTSLVSPNIYGQVEDGFIKVSGRLAKVSAVIHKRINDDVAPFYKLKVNLHTGNPISVEGEVRQDSTFENDSYVWDTFEDLYYIAVRQIANNPGRTEGILLQAADKGSGLFNRFGTFNAGSPAGNQDGPVFEEAFDTFELFAEELALNSCRDKEERKMYTITIV